MQGNASLPKGCLNRRFETGTLFITYSLLIQASPALRGACGPTCVFVYAAALLTS